MSDAGVEGRTIEAIDVMRVMEMIPHRYPFLMIDRAVDLVADVSAVGIKKDRKSTRLNSSHIQKSRMPSSA